MEKPTLLIFFPSIYLTLIKVVPEGWAVIVTVTVTVTKDATTRRTRKVSMPGSVFLHYEAYS